ncbi:unnamed protein product [marine sediment metagenome]|uniref:Uncharacterized protein n=1 Tax=marine sediment metagenome TaxID=412755 RepID=X1HKZ2_9ZZZZ
MAEELALKAASLFADGATHRDISKDLEVSKSSVGKLIRDGYSILKNRSKNPDENPGVQMDGKTEDKDKDRDELSPSKFSDNKELDDLMTRTLLIHATPILRKIALNSKVFLQHEYFQKQLGYTGDVGDLLVEALDFYWEEMGFQIKITHDLVM